MPCDVVDEEAVDGVLAAALEFGQYGAIDLGVINPILIGKGVLTRLPAAS